MSQQPVVAFGGSLAGTVGVEGLPDAAVAAACQVLGLRRGQGRPEWGVAGDLPVTGCGDGDGVQGSLDPDRPGPCSCLVDAEEVVSFGVGRGGGGVQVLGCGVVAGQVPADESEGGAGLVADRDRGAVAEEVDGVPAGGDPCEAGVDDLLIVGAQPA